jgi:hypothetical protein
LGGFAKEVGVEFDVNKVLLDKKDKNNERIN